MSGDDDELFSRPATPEGNYDPKRSQRTRADDVLDAAGGGPTVEERNTCSGCKSVNTVIRGNGVSGTITLLCRDCGYRAPIGERIHAVKNLRAQQVASRPGPFYSNTPRPTPLKNAPAYRTKSRPARRSEED